MFCIVFYCKDFRVVANSFGVSSGPIFLENLACSGMEESLLACPHSVLGTHDCGHTQDVAVQCFGMGCSCDV